MQMMEAGIEEEPFHAGEPEQEMPARREPEMGPEIQQEMLEFASDAQDEDARVPAYLRRWKQKGQRMMR
jgi:hypothetical protein